MDARASSRAIARVVARREATRWEIFFSIAHSRAIETTRARDRDDARASWIRCGNARAVTLERETLRERRRARERAREARARAMKSMAIDGLELVLGECARADAFEATADARAWDDVLRAFDAFCDASANGRFEDVDGIWAMESSLGGFDGDERRRRAASAAREHIASVIRDALRVGDGGASDDGERETKRREAEDAKTAVRYVRTRVNARLRSMTDTGTKNRLKALRDMFVAELRAFDVRTSELERRAGETTAKMTGGLCLNLPDPAEVLRRTFKSSIANVLDAFDGAIERLSIKSAKTPTRSGASSRDAERAERSNSTNEGANSASSVQGRHNDRARKVLSQWLWDHFYPTEERLKPIPTRAEKEELARLSGLTPTQVGDWFVNARARLWKPYIEGLIRGVYNDATVKRALDLQADAAA